MSRRRRRPVRRGGTRSRLARLRRWLTLPRLWAIISLLAVLVLIVSLLAPVFSSGSAPGF